MWTELLDTRAATILHKAKIGPLKMLSCGRVFGRLSKVTRGPHSKYLYQSLKYIEILGRCSSNSSNKEPSKPVGTTIKPEECTPSSRFSKSKRPPCEASAVCPSSCYQEPQKDDFNKESCDKGSGNGRLPKYWKQILATLIITGATIYMVSSNWLSSEKSPHGTSKKKKADKKKKLSRLKTPATSSSIPQQVSYLLIGGGTAAFSAFRSIKSRDPKAKVLVISEEEDFPYMRPPLSKELWYNADRAISAQVNFKQWNGIQRSLFYEPREFYASVDSLNKSDKGGVAVATGWKITKIDVVNRIATLDDGHEINYDKCLIATGAVPKDLLVFESAETAVKDKIIVFRTKQDFLELEENVYDPNCKNIVVIGGGFLGSELASSLARNLGEDKKIFQIYKEKYIMAQVLPEYLSEWTTKKAQVEGVNCISNAEVEDFSYKNGQLSLLLTGGRSLDVNQVIVAVGVVPNTELARTSDLEVHPQIGGFLVNAELEARSNLWVAGDAACFYDIKLGRRRVEHHDHAVISGRLAGENMTGAGKPYLHQSMFWSDLGPEIGYEAIGIVDSSLPTVGVFAKGTKPPTRYLSASNELTETSGEKETLLQHPETSAVITNVQNSNEEQQKDVDDICPIPEPDNFGKGVIFYLRNDVVVGILLWNIFNRMSVARQVLARETRYDDLNEVAKLFAIHDD